MRKKIIVNSLITIFILLLILLFGLQNYSRAETYPVIPLFNSSDEAFKYLLQSYRDRYGSTQQYIAGDQYDDGTWAYIFYDVRDADNFLGFLLFLANHTPDGWKAVGPNLVSDSDYNAFLQNFPNTIFDGNDKAFYSQQINDGIMNFNNHYLPWALGYNGYVTKKDGSGHEGQIDFDIQGNSIDGNVYATKSGTVVFVKESSDYGCTNSSCWEWANMVVIQHGPSEYSWYVHLKYNSVPVNKDDYVQSGTIIGVEGMTGWSCNSNCTQRRVHLHYMVSSGHGAWTDPNDPYQAPWGTGMQPVDFIEVSWANIQVGQQYTSQNAPPGGPTPTPSPTPPPQTSGWNQTFYSDNYLGNQCGTRNETDMYMFRDSEGGWSLPGGCPGIESAWSVRMERSDAYFQGGDYEFGLFYDDGARLYVDGVLKVDGWDATQHYETHYVSPGNHNLRLEYKNNVGHAIVQLWWRGPGALPYNNQTQDPYQWWVNYWGNQTQWQDAVGSANEGQGFINRDWGSGGPGYGIPSDHFSLKFRRTVFFYCGVYSFHIFSDDGSRLAIDGNIIPEFDHWSTNVWDTTANLNVADGYHELQLDYFENGGGAAIVLEWQFVSACPEPPTPTPSPTPTTIPGHEHDSYIPLIYKPVINLIQNPGFESGYYQPNINPAYWQKNYWNSGSSFIWDNNIHRSGTKSVKLYASQNNDIRWIQSVQVEPDTAYILSGWIKTINVLHGGGSNQAGANIGLFGYWERTAALFGTNDWTYKSIEFNSGDRTNITIACRLGHWDGIATGTMWCDDIVLKQKN